jgi:hypothetical protein
VKAMDEIQDPEYKIYKKLFEAKIYWFIFQETRT